MPLHLAISLRRFQLLYPKTYFPTFAQNLYNDKQNLYNDKA